MNPSGNSLAHRFMYNQGTSGKNFQGKEGKSFKVERQFDLGLNLDMTKFRMYDYALGRFTSIDPLADANPQESLTPYQYAFNNPILYNDPYGDCPKCWDFIKGFGTTLAGMGESMTPVGQVKGVYNQAVGIYNDVSEGKGALETLGNATGVNQAIETVEKAASGDMEAIGSVTAVVVTVVATKKFAGKAPVKTTPRGKPGKLTKQPRGKGSVPKAERPKPRMPSKKQQKAQYDKDGGKCQNCNNKTSQENTTQHHYPKRHADGGSKTTTVCKECHSYLHSKD